MTLFSENNDETPDDETPDDETPDDATPDDETHDDVPVSHLTSRVAV